jgi:hypothetical protein
VKTSRLIVQILVLGKSGWVSSGVSYGKVLYPILLLAVAIGSCLSSVDSAAMLLGNGPRADRTFH